MPESTRERVFRSLALTVPRTALRYTGSFAGLPLKLSSLLDTQPLVRTAATGVDWRRLHANVASGLVDALAVVATSADVRSTVFVHRRDGIALPDGDEDRARREYRVVPYVFAGPRRRDELGVLAADVYRERYGGVKAVRSPDFWFLHRLLGDEEPGAGDLLSYVFFEPEYIERAIELGRRHARKVIGAAGDPFRPPLLEGTR